MENLSNCSGLMFIRSVASNIQTAMHHCLPFWEALPLYQAAEAQDNRQMLLELEVVKLFTLTETHRWQHKLKHK